MCVGSLATSYRGGISDRLNLSRRDNMKIAQEAFLGMQDNIQ